jgi:3-deoxy-D-manno-octulosonate 8-phosphate phosphatase (KDO 8-P phosphatase)
MDSTDYSNIKIIVTAVDGVFTNGAKGYNNKGEIVYKTFVDRDFDALVMLAKHFEVAAISTCNEVSPFVFSKHGFGMYYTKNKKEKLSQLLRLKGLTPDQCIYVGSDLEDLPCVRMIPITFCSRDSCDEVKRVAIPLSAVAGGGVVYSLYKILLPEITIRYKFYK